MRISEQMLQPTQLRKGSLSLSSNEARQHDSGMAGKSMTFIEAISLTTKEIELSRIFQASSIRHKAEMMVNYQAVKADEPGTSSMIDAFSSYLH